MVALRPYILYRLPISQTTQALKGGKIEKVWANISNFLTTCTNADINNPENIYLVAYSANEDFGEHTEQANRIIDITKEVFGEGITETIGYLYPENTPLKQTKTVWQLTSNDLDKALNFIIGLQPLPKYNLGPIELIISYDFKLMDQTTKIELPHQQYSSSLLLWLTRSNCVSPSLCFPFKQADEEFWQYIEKIEESIPFNFGRKHLRLGKANKKGTANKFSKL